MLNALKEFLTQKKGQVAVATFIVAISAKFGFDIPVDTVLLIISPFLTYMFSQGMSDFGKSAKQIEAVNPPPPDKIEQTVNVDTSSEREEQ